MAFGAGVGVLVGVKEAVGTGVRVASGVRVTCEVLVGVKEALGGRVGVGVNGGAGVMVAASEEAGVRVIGGFSTTTGVKFDPLVTGTQAMLKPNGRRSSSIRQFFIPSLFSPFICGSARISKLHQELCS